MFAKLLQKIIASQKSNTSHHCTIINASRTFVVLCKPHARTRARAHAFRCTPTCACEWSDLPTAFKQDFVRPNKPFRVRFRSTFQGCEYIVLDLGHETFFRFCLPAPPSGVCETRAARSVLISISLGTENDTPLLTTNEEKMYKRSINETIRLDDGADVLVAGGVACLLGVVERAKPPSNRAFAIIDRWRIDSDECHDQTVERAQREHDPRTIQQTGALCHRGRRQAQSQ